MSQPRSADGAPDGGEALTDMFSAAEVYERVAATADSEFGRTPRMLLFSGVAAGLSLGITFLARSALGAATDSGGGLPGDLLYPIGFIVVVLGRYQLFTENTLTPITLVLHRVASIPALLRLWGIVFAANLLGAAGAALLLSAPDALEPGALVVASEIANEALTEPTWTLFIRSVMAGALVGSMVWLVHAVRSGLARIVIVYGLMLLIPIAGLHHCITGFCEVIFAMLEGGGSPLDALRFLAVVALGNTLGGVLLVAMINYGQTAERLDGHGDGETLSWGQFLFARHLPRSRGDSVAPELDDAS